MPGKGRILKKLLPAIGFLVVIAVFWTMALLRAASDNGPLACFNDQSFNLGLAPVEFSAEYSGVLKPAQKKNAEIAMGVVWSHVELTPAERRRLATIVLIVGMVETKFINYKVKTDATSMGIYAQQNSWGTFEQRTDPAQATELLISGGAILGPGDTSEDGILDKPNWRTMPVGEVAWRVQLPLEKYRGRYAEWVDFAEQFLASSSTQFPTSETLAQPITSVDNCVPIAGADGSVNYVEAYVQAALTQVGESYQWGGNDPEVGFDGSGLIAWSLNEAGVETKDMTAAGLYDSQVKIPSPSPDNLRRGDLVYWGDDKSHVAIWLGDNKILEARRAGAKIGIHPMRWDSTVTATRLPDSYRSAPGSSTWRPPIEGRLVATSAYGQRFHPILKRWQPHEGIDLDARANQPVFALATGRVTEVRYTSGGGHRVAVKYAGDIVVTVKHMAQRASVAQGQVVTAGTTIGYAGSSGLSTGVHLHIEVREKGVLVDPYPVFVKHGLAITGRVAR